MKAHALAACILTVISNGCNDSERSAPDAESSTIATWQRNGSGRWIVPLEGTKSDSNLQQAIAAGRRKARTTLAQAQLEWSTLTANRQRDWAIVWAAPTYEESNATEELLWVIPVSWTPHRVEATLATSPTLRSDLSLGTLVAFPSEEIADWADFSSTPPRGAAILEQLEYLIGAAPKEDS